MRDPLRFNLVLLPFLFCFQPSMFLISVNQSILIAFLGSLAFLVYYFLDKKASIMAELREKNIAIDAQKKELEEANRELELKNTSLDLLNKKLVSEMAERENIQNFSFARDRYLANTSSEMRSPLNNINHLTHSLLESSPREDQVEALRNLQFSVNDLVVFINDMLNFSKIEVGKVNLADREFNLAASIRSVQNRFEQQVKEKGLLFNLECDADVPENLLGDQARLVQIVSNLLSKMIHQTDEGMVDVHFSAENTKWSTITLKIAVSGTDNGQGLQLLENLQQPSKEELEKGQYDRQDLSLAIAKRLIELQNGTLEVESRAGLGTAFLVSMPFKNINKEKKLAVSQASRNYSNLEGTHVLLVEDNKVNQIIVANLLRKVGMDVTTADNGKEALEIFERQDFDLVLMDVQMPEMNGYQATAEIRRHSDTNKFKVPIIALTSSAFLTAKEKAKLFGMNDHVGKPFSPEELLEKISHCLEFCKTT